MKSFENWRKKNKIKKKKKRQFPEVQNVNQTVAFLRSKSNKFKKPIKMDDNLEKSSIEYF